MPKLNVQETERAIALANLLCVRSDEGSDAIIGHGDLELVALGLVVLASLADIAGQGEDS